MKPFDEAGTHNPWKAALAPSAECIPIPRFAEALSTAEAQHLAACPRCQAEQALWREFQQSAPREAEGAAVAWIALELSRRFGATPARRSPWWRRWMQVPVGRLSGALAAVLVLAAGVSIFTLRSRTGLAPQVLDEGALRSQSVVLLSPLGDQEARPVDLRWEPVPSAATYQVELLEVDHHALWKSETAQTHLAIPDNIRALLVPGKALLWQVTAKSQSAVLASSGLQKFRVKVKRTSGGEL